MVPSSYKGKSELHCLIVQRSIITHCPHCETGTSIFLR